MTLHEFLKCCDDADYVGIWDISGDLCRKHKSKKRFQKCPTQQRYFKIGNIPYGRIKCFLEKEIVMINHSDKGYLVRIHNKGEAKANLDRYDLARKIADEIKRR